MSDNTFYTTLSLLFGAICIYTTVMYVGFVQIDEDRDEKPDREGWFFSIYPRRVGNDTIFFRYCYMKKWYGYQHDGYNGLAYIRYYTYNPHIPINEDSDE